MANIDILVGQKVKLSIVPTIASSSGVVAADIVGIPTWVATTPAVVSLNPASDGRTCVVTGKVAGSSVVTATAQGASVITSNDTIVVAASNLATAIDLTAERIDD